MSEKCLGSSGFVDDVLNAKGCFPSREGMVHVEEIRVAHPLGHGALNERQGFVLQGFEFRTAQDIADHEQAVLEKKLCLIRGDAILLGGINLREKFLGRCHAPKVPCAENWIVPFMRKIVSEANRGSLGYRVWQGRAGRMVSAHAHTDVELNYLVNGRLRYFFGGRFETILPGELVVFWAGIPHQLVAVAPGTQMVWVTVPLAWVMQWKLSDAFRHRLLRGQLVRRVIAAEIPVGWAQEFGAAHGEAREIVLLEVEAQVRRMAVADVPPLHLVSTAGDVIERATRIIGERYSERLRVSEIAQAVGMHPHSLMRLFRKRCGMSLWEYVIRLRVSHAQRLLITTDRKVTDIALDAGFGSVGRFHATFRRLTGQTPRAYRLTLGGAHKKVEQVRLHC